MRTDSHSPYSPHCPDALEYAEGTLGFCMGPASPGHCYLSRLAGVPNEQLQGALTLWVAEEQMVVSADGKQARQPVEQQRNPLVMALMLAHGLKLCLAQWSAAEKRRYVTQWPALP